MAVLIPIFFSKNHLAKPSKTVVEIAIAKDQFSTLVATLKAAILAGALSGERLFTIFAPTNETFEKLPEGTVETLLKPENKDKLANILKYHVVSAKAMTADIKAGEMTMLNEKKSTISIKDGKVMIDRATVVKTDTVGKNGVILPK